MAFFPKTEGDRLPLESFSGLVKHGAQPLIPRAHAMDIVEFVWRLIFLLYPQEEFLAGFARTCRQVTRIFFQFFSLGSAFLKALFIVSPLVIRYWYQLIESSFLTPLSPFQLPEQVASLAPPCWNAEYAPLHGDIISQNPRGKPGLLFLLGCL